MHAHVSDMHAHVSLHTFPCVKIHVHVDMCMFFAHVSLTVETVPLSIFDSPAYLTFYQSQQRAAESAAPKALQAMMVA